MTVLTVLTHPDKRLKKVAQPVDKFNDSIKKIVSDMFETMYAHHGIGLAATQVDIQQRIVVMDIPENPEMPDAPHGKHVFINPEITWLSEEKAFGEEGCLSVPGQYAEVERSTAIKYQYRDIDGTLHQKEAEGLLAVCMQHEIDHLDGILFIDHLSRLKRERIEKKLAKLLKAKAAS